MYRKLIVASCLLLALSGITWAQGAAGDWLAVQSDDGEFAIDIPQAYTFVYDDAGFTVSNGRDGHALRKMEMLNGIKNGTLISVERYVASKDALTNLYEHDRKTAKVVADTSEARASGLKYRRVVWKTDKFYSVRQYFYTKDHAYVLIAASRDGETPEMLHFFDSVSVQVKPPQAVTNTATQFSRLRHSKVLIDDLTNQPTPTPPAGGAPLQVPKPGPGDKPLVIVGKPLASYTEAARAARVSGRIIMKIEFAADGSIPRLGYLRSLQGGMARQTMMAAPRIKFLPAERDGVAISTTKTVEYSFEIY
jgi:hypothetical protein